ncbi:MAG: cysteine synthase family protein [Gemmatimonadota bacterium]
MVLHSIADAIGHTPLVRLSRLAPDVDGTILAKLEYLNPGSSKKDRVARGIIVAAEESGALRPGQTVIELTSGNMGTGLALVCAAHGYRFVAVMSKGNSEERARMMRALGAEVVLVDQCPGSTVGEVSGPDLAAVEEETRRLTAQLGAFRADQFEHPANHLAHYTGTGPEIWEQSAGQITAFCDFVGSGGTFSGCARYFKERDPGVECFVVEPAGAAPLSGAPVRDPRHPIQGGGYAMPTLTQLAGVQPDGYLEVSGETAATTARALARREGIFAGYSAGANVAAALELLRGSRAGGTVAVVICDSGLKYLSTGLWTERFP